MALADAARRARPVSSGIGSSPRPEAELRWCTRPTYLDAVRRAGETLRAGSRPRPRYAGRPGLRRNARGERAGGRRVTRWPPRAVVEGRTDHGVNISRRAAPCDAGPGRRVLRLQRPGDRDRVAAGPGGASASPTSTSTSTTATACRRSSGTTRGCSPSACTSRGARCSPAPGSRPTSAARTRRAAPSTSRSRRVRRDLSWHAAFDAVVPPAAGARSRRTVLRHPARLRHARARPAGQPAADRGRSAVGARSSCTTSPTELCDGRWLAVGGGGYELVQVVPRTWTHLLAIASGRPIDPDVETPPTWREFVHDRTGHTAPTRMTDGRPVTGEVPAAVLQSIDATRAAVFPHHEIGS